MDSQEKMQVIFATTPKRVETPKFRKFFGEEGRIAVPEIDLSICLKRREPKQDPDDAGRMRVIPGDECCQEDFLRAARALLGKGFARTLLNAENAWNDRENDLLLLPKEAGILVSGADLLPEAALEMLGRSRGRQRFLALENEQALLAGAKIIREEKPDGLVIGSSYLSESSRMYDSLGLDRYRSLLKALGAKARKEGIEVYTTSSYCTFDPEGKGDKNKEFVQSQVEFVTERGNWGSITRYYSHLEWANSKRIELRASHGEGI